MPRAAVRRALPSILVVVAAVGCAAPVRAVVADPVDVRREANACVLDGGGPGTEARLVLERAGLAEAWADDPAAAIETLHGMAAAGDTRDRLFGLAELCADEGARARSRRHWAGAAVYAYLFLFGSADSPAPGPFDPRFRAACDLYARGVAEAFRTDADGRFVPACGPLELPVGSLDVQSADAGIEIEGTILDRMYWSDEFEIVGMRSRVRTGGLGAPMIVARGAATPGPEPDLDPRVGRMAGRLEVAGTALLEFDGELHDLARGALPARLRVLSPVDVPEIVVRGRRVPVAADVTAPIARTLTETSPWHTELAGFLSQDEAGVEDRLLFMRPYQRGRIPLVLVHGTVSSPARWAELVNEIHADPVIATRYQVWLFQYATGVPILVSAESLRGSLEATVSHLDPVGTDSALRRMVVVGHSQGGLLARLVVSSSGTGFWDSLRLGDFESLEADAETKDYLRRVLFFEPLPTVERVVFVSTPHHGSFVAGGIFGRIGSALVSLPRNLVDGASSVLQQNFLRLGIDPQRELETAVDDMQPGSRFLGALDLAPISPRIRVHSIVSVEGDGPPESLDDGVVEYSSAHRPRAESELVVRSPHSCQGHPQTVLEIRRILREHLAAR